MNLLRKLFRIPLFLFWFSLVTFTGRVFNHGKKSSERALTLTLIWARVAAWIFNLKINVVGEAPDFKGGLIAANHQGVLDVLVLASVFRIRFAPKAEMRRWPLLGTMTQCNEPVWIDRSTPRKAKFSAEAMCKTMQSGQAMMVFPEGTTSNGKNGLLPFKSTAFQAALDSGSKILPVIIEYEEQYRTQIQWCGQTAFAKYLWGVLGLKKTCVTLYIMDTVTPRENEERKDLAARVYAIMDEKWRSL